MQPSIEISIYDDSLDYYDHEGYYDNIDEAIDALIRLKHRYEEGE